jgi:hypothetical protein
MKRERKNVLASYAQFRPINPLVAVANVQKIDLTRSFFSRLLAGLACHINRFS